MPWCSDNVRKRSPDTEQCSPGQWRNPVDQSKHKNRLDYWINLAKLLDRGKFNALFLADNFGSHDVYEGSHAAAIRAGTQWPMYDPFVVSIREHALGISGFLMSYIDHISNGGGHEECCLRSDFLHDL